MILDEIVLSGFGSYKDKTIIKIPLGLTGIIGSYEDNPQKSIGSGKTTCVAALNYALFGEGEFDKIEELMNDQLTTKDFFFANVKFEQGSSKFEVERGRAPDSYLEFKENTNPRGDPNIGKRTAEIKKVVGMDYDMFTASVFFEQDKLSKMIDTDPSVRRSYVEKVLGTDLWTDASKLVTKEKNSLKKEVETLQREIINLGYQIEEYEKQLVTEETLEMLLQKEVAYKKSLDERFLLLKLLKDKKQQLVDKQSEKQQLEKKIKEYTKKIEDSKKLLLSHQERLGILTREYTNICSILLDSKSNRDKSKVDKEKQESFIAEVIEKIHSIEINITKLQAEKRSLQQSKSDIKLGKCPTCQQDVDKIYLETKHSEITRKLLTIDVDICTDMRSKKDVEVTKCEAVQQLSVLKKLLDVEETQIHESEERAKRIDSEISSIKNYFKTSEAIEVEYQKQIDDSNTLLVQVNTKIEELLLEVSEELDEKEFDQVSSKVSTSQSEISRLNQELGKLKQVTQDLENIKAILYQKNDMIQQKEYSLSIEKILEEEFDVIPSQILTTSVASIEKETDDIIHTFMPEMNVCVKEDLSKVNKPLQIYFTVNNKRRNYKRLSGGQRTIANLALRLGFSKVIASRVGTHIDFLILDEPFGYLDSFTRDLIKKILTELKKHFKQIIVISHVDNVQDFPNLIKVVMDEFGVSRLNEGAKI